MSISLSIILCLYHLSPLIIHNIFAILYTKKNVSMCIALLARLEYGHVHGYQWSRILI